MSRRSRFAILALVLVVPVVALIAAGSASGKAANLANRFAPSGTVTVDPANHPSLPLGTHRLPSSVALSVTGSSGCVDNTGTNVRVNQECTNQSTTLGRSQSQNETGAAVNPINLNNILASANDYRRGDSNCGVYFSLDGGRHWGGGVAPMGFTTPGFTAPRHYWTTGGDTSVGFDSSGEAYLMCQVFDRDSSTADNSTPFGASGFLLFRSADGGASWSFPGSAVALANGTGSDGIGLLDKEYMAIDANSGSAFKDRIYVAYVQYSTDFTSDPVHFEYSSDHGVTWHDSGVISGSSATLCPINFSGAPAGTCDANQFVDPFVAPNGDVYVVFQNFNNCSGSLAAFGFPCGGDPNDNHNQMLIVKSVNGGATFGPPVKVTDFYDLPDCFTYTGQDFGRACIPTAPLSGTSIFRAEDYPSGVALSSTNIVVDFGSYLNAHSNPVRGNCAPAGISSSTFINKYTRVGVVNGCNNDIVESVSTNSGGSFTGASVPPWSLPSVNDEGSTLADQWWQWSAKNPAGADIVAYYDRKYGSDQSSGFMDISVASPSGHTRVTSLSMPPSNEFPAANGYSLFMGDYNAVAVGADGAIHPVWADTRNPILTYNPAADARKLLFAGFGADIYTARLGGEP
jgi:hypothetical protein